ncbi:MAG: flagellar motor switch protein FliN [Planctomycetaceae bacterium]|nr:flagellar motor switch protein FliN [Planctomycetaceae bacterium]
MTDKAPEKTESEVEAALDQATEAVRVRTQQLDELVEGAGGGAAVGLGQLYDVPVRLTVEVGRARLPLGDLIRLGPGSLVELDREAHEAADILVNGKVVARGEVVTIGEHYGVRITSLTGE